jgi:hypothetical protein
MASTQESKGKRTAAPRTEGDSGTSGASYARGAVRKVSQVLDGARQSLKLFESFEKGTIARARTLVKIPTGAESRRLRDEKILASLRKVGVATNAEVEALRMRIERLEAQLATRERDHADETASAFPQS